MEKYIISAVSIGDYIAGHGCLTKGKRYDVLEYRHDDGIVKIIGDDGSDGTPGVEMWPAEHFWEDSKVHGLLPGDTEIRYWEITSDYRDENLKDYIVRTDSRIKGESVQNMYDAYPESWKFAAQKQTYSLTEEQKKSALSVKEFIALVLGK